MNEKSRHILENRVREAIAEGIRQELGDPRIELAMPSVTSVKISPDMSIVHVNISVFGEEGACTACWSGLVSGRKRLQTFMGQRLKTRIVPQLVLHRDESLKKAAEVMERIDESMKDIAAREAAAAPPPAPAGGEPA